MSDGPGQRRGRGRYGIAALHARAVPPADRIVALRRPLARRWRQFAQLHGRFAQHRARQCAAVRCEDDGDIGVAARWGDPRPGRDGNLADPLFDDGRHCVVDPDDVRADRRDPARDRAQFGDTRPADEFERALAGFVAGDGSAGHDDRVGGVASDGHGGKQSDGGKKAHGRFLPMTCARLANRHDISSV